jgi:dihydrofolate synthase/folylpolyglutamate synthase
MTPRAYLASLEQFGIKLGLEQIRALVAALDRPDRAFRSILIAGTNGKGSVTAMVERALRAAGLRTGRYISPHLNALEERFAIDGRNVASDTLDAAIERLRTVASTLPAPPSYFEATTAVALDLFREARVDVAVLEVGLGGRLDATNVVEPIAVAITAVDFDHEAHLGPTIESIAREKAGIIKPGVVAVLGRNSTAVRSAVRAQAEAASARLVYAPDEVVVDAGMGPDGRTQLSLTTPVARYRRVNLALRGRHQVDNAVTAVRLLESLPAVPAPVPAAAIVTGLEDAVWPARLQLLPWRGGDVLLDGAHNPAGARALAAYVAETYRRPLPFVVGVMSDKKIDGMLAALAPAASGFWFTAPASARAAPPSQLVEIAARVAADVPARAVAVPFDAIAAALVTGSPVVVAGSLYLAGEVLRGRES